VDGPQEVSAMMGTECEHLRRYARDSQVPYRHIEGSNCYVLDLGPNLSIPNEHCIFCGGHGFPHMTRDYWLRARCHCGALQRWAQDAAVPIEYNSELNEYNLIHRSGSDNCEARRIYFCPACGGRAPLSHRGDLCTRPSWREMDAINRRVAGGKTVEQIVGVLGEPDVRLGPFVRDAQKKEIYGVKDVNQSLTYSSLGHTCELHVQEYADGTFDLSFFGKAKLRRTVTDRLRRWVRRAWDILR
jgi:hypothetical protein